MTFSYWGADRITIQKPVLSKRRQVITTRGGVRRGPPSSIRTYGSESSANAKFGTRLMSAESNVLQPRPSSRRTGTTTLVHRPAWLENPRPTSTPVPKDQRGTSEPNAIVVTKTPDNNSTTKLFTPSEDSDIGIYRRLLANDPSLTA